MVNIQGLNRSASSVLVPPKLERNRSSPYPSFRSIWLVMGFAFLAAHFVRSTHQKNIDKNALDGLKVIRFASSLWCFCYFL